MGRTRLRSLFPSSMLGLVVIVASACGGGDESRTEPAVDEPITREGTNIDSPLGALRALGDLANRAESLQEEIANMVPVDPVHFSTLLEALPEAPEGWKAGQPRGQTNRLGDYSMSTAENSYEGPDGMRIEITISDYAFNQIAYSGFALAAAFSQESTEGYNKGILVGEDPGREEYNNQTRTGVREVLYGKRFHIQVDGQNVSPDDLASWYQAVKKDALPVK